MVEASAKGKEAYKGARWMPRLSETTKDVVSCEKLRGGANDRYIRRCPNGATQQVEDLLPVKAITQGTETSNYLEEKKTIVIP